MNQERLLKEKMSLADNHQKVLQQLKALFAAYNELKASLEKTKDKLKNSEDEATRLQASLSEKNRENEMLKSELEKAKRQHNDEVERLKVTHSITVGRNCAAFFHQCRLHAFQQELGSGEAKAQEG